MCADVTVPVLKIEERSEAELDVVDARDVRCEGGRARRGGGGGARRDVPWKRLDLGGGGVGIGDVVGGEVEGRDRTRSGSFGGSDLG